MGRSVRILLAVLFVSQAHAVRAQVPLFGDKELRFRDTRPDIFVNFEYSSVNSQALFVDVNGDGHRDIVWANASIGLQVALNHGDGTFDRAYEFRESVDPFGFGYEHSQGLALISSAPYSARHGRLSGPVAVGDLNGDGRVDLVAGLSEELDEFGVRQGTGVRIMLGTGETLPFYSLPLLFVPAPHDTTYPDMPEPRSLTLTDVDGDGALDLIVLAGDTGPRSFWQRGGGDGTFGPPTELPSPNGAGFGRTTSMSVADFNHDGRGEVVTCDDFGGNVLRYDAGEARFVVAASFSGFFPDGPLSMINCNAGDFDGDGHTDLLIATDGVRFDPVSGPERKVRLLVMRGTADLAVFEPSVIFSRAGLATAKIFVADFNADGLSDIAVLADHRLRVFRSAKDTSGWLGFAPTDEFVTDEGDSLDNRQPAIGDLNGDGLADFGYIASPGCCQGSAALLMSQPPATRALADGLVSQVESLSAQMAGLQQQLGASQQQFADSQALVALLQGHVHDLETANLGLQTLIDTLAAERNTARSERDAALAARDAALATILSLTAQRDAAIAGRAAAYSERDAALALAAALTTERNNAVAAVALANAARTAALATVTTVTAQRDAALASVAQLQQQVAQLQQQLAAATGPNAVLNLWLTAVQQLLRIALGSPTFVIPGATPQERLVNLLTGIASLNHGQQQALGKAIKH